MLTEEIQKRGHEVILTKTSPRVLSVLMGIGTHLHVHHTGTDIEDILKGFYNHKIKF